MRCLMNSFSWGVSIETASIQWRRQMLRASSQSTSRLRVGLCSQLKKYEWATPRASRYVACRTPGMVKFRFSSCDIDIDYDKFSGCTFLTNSQLSCNAQIIRRYTITIVTRGVIGFVFNYWTRFPTMTRLLISDVCNTTYEKSEFVCFPCH